LLSKQIPFNCWPLGTSVTGAMLASAAMQIGISGLVKDRRGSSTPYGTPPKTPISDSKLPPALPVQPPVGVIKPPLPSIPPRHHKKESSPPSYEKSIQKDGINLLFLKLQFCSSFIFYVDVTNCKLIYF